MVEPVLSALALFIFLETSAILDTFMLLLSISLDEGPTLVLMLLVEPSYVFVALQEDVGQLFQTAHLD